jgi:Ca2+-binding RTX toxin-like protein
MAYVQTFGGNFSMFGVAQNMVIDGSPSGLLNAQGYLDMIDGQDQAAMRITGQFAPAAGGNWAGTVKEFSLTASAKLPNLMITGLSFKLTPQFKVDYSAGAVGTVLEHLLAGNDTLFKRGGTGTMMGFGGNDLFLNPVIGDKFYGGSGNDTVSFELHTTGFFTGLEDMATSGGADGVQFVDVENLIGGSGHDTLYGNAANNRLSGKNGNDTFCGKAGADTFDGGVGSDKVNYDSSTGVRASLLDRTQNTGDAKGDRYISIENLAGSSANDTLFGNNAANRIEGNDYPDLDHTPFLDADRLFGLGGNDRLFGYWGNDDLTGGLGADQSTGGVGQDDFIFNSAAESTNASRDRIMDFDRTEGDKIKLAGVDANANAAGNQAFTFRANAAFTGAAGQLRYQHVGNDTHILGDTNGDRVADFVIVSDLVTNFVRGDFVL